LIKSIAWHPLGIAATRSGIAAVILWVWLRRPQFSWALNQIGGALAYVATVVLFVFANQWTTAANAIFLQYTAPIYVAIAGPLLLGEPARRLDWACVVLALIGIALFFRDDFSPTGGWGIAMALGSGFAFGALVIFLRREKDGSPLSILLLGNIATALIGLPFAISELPPAAAWGPLVALGVFQLGIPYLLYGLAIRRVTALEAIVILMLEPILNPLWVALVHGEIPGAWSIAGAGLVLVAVTIRGLARRTN
jgi:drug/metabolite transporter (DMT)-like permease